MPDLLPALSLSTGADRLGLCGAGSVYDGYATESCAGGIRGQKCPYPSLTQTESKSHFESRRCATASSGARKLLRLPRCLRLGE
jgi:hypothetical protein